MPDCHNLVTPVSWLNQLLQLFTHVTRWSQLLRGGHNVYHLFISVTYAYTGYQVVTPVSICSHMLLAGHTCYQDRVLSMRPCDNRCLFQAPQAQGDRGGAGQAERAREAGAQGQGAEGVPAPGTGGGRAECKWCCTVIMG